ncbi:alkaline phosphatase family protein [Mycobacterium sp.]|uniref:alkaline phosphatase family protein n=1 Tax=Mycobacterium sp. TaxID=1785 RepID=UPI003F9C60CC
MTAAANQLGSVEHIVVLVLENRSFDHMLGFLYADSANVSPLTKQPFEGLTGNEVNSDASGASIPVSALTPGTANVYFTPGADPGEGFVATNMQLFGETSPPAGIPATNHGFVTDFAATLKGIDAHRPVISGTTASDIMGIFTPAVLRWSGPAFRLASGGPLAVRGAGSPTNEGGPIGCGRHKTHKELAAWWKL